MVDITGTVGLRQYCSDVERVMTTGYPCTALAKINEQEPSRTILFTGGGILPPSPQGIRRQHSYTSIRDFCHMSAVRTDCYDRRSRENAPAQRAFGWTRGLAVAI